MQLSVALVRTLSIAVVTLLAAPVEAQVSAEPSGGVSSNERWVYVLRGDTLHQFDAATLTWLRSVAMPGAAKSPTNPAPRAGTGTDAQIAAESEPEPEAPRVAKPEVGNAAELALDWLCKHQDPDGKWDADEFVKHDPEGRQTDGPGTPTHDVGVTALSLLALLGSGNTPTVGPRSDATARAVKWLVSQQSAVNGLIGSSASHEFIYDHAVATFAIVEAYGLSGMPALKPKAQRAINYLESHRNPYSVWRYQPRGGDNDMSVTGWCVLAYCAARDHGLEINAQALTLAEGYIDQLTDPETGRTGYSARGEQSSRLTGDHSVRFPRDRSEAMTALALFNRFLLGQNPAENPILGKQADLVLQKLPTWNPETGSVDCVGWLFGSWAMYQVGGDHWREWNRAMASTLTKAQRRDGSFAGSWDPVGPWGEIGGRVYSTACLALTLQISYRYSRLVR